MNIKKRFIVALIATAAANMQILAQMLPYQNPNLSSSERADDLIGRLTLEEKSKLMMDQSPAIKRLGIPEFHWWNEALHGVGRNGTATVFPITMCMAASWNDALLQDVFTAVSDEARAKNQEAKKSGTLKRYQCLSFWTPNINIFRDPRWGRGQETYGEDPYLTSKMGLAVVRGLQGPENSKYRKLLACAKHFAVHSGPEWNRHSFDVQQLPARDLWETYLPAFKTLVQEGNVAEVMCAYQRIDGEPCCGNNRFEHQILREEWGYKGLITSDCWAIRDFYDKGCHEVSKDAAEASATAVRAGTDLECGSAYKALPEAVKRGEITEKELDKSLKKLIMARIELGDFDNDSLVEWTRIPSSVVACKKHKQMALDMARQGTVLLKNNGLLPLDKDAKIVVMGPNANDAEMMWGNYNGTPTATMTILDGIHNYQPEARFIRGCGHTRNSDSLRVSDIIYAVRDADIVVFAGGISPRLEGEEMKVNEVGFKGGDRTDIELPKKQRQLLAALHDAGKKVVLVNCSGSAVALEPEISSCDAILQAWYGGEQGGTAVAEILFGDVNPSGKLPVTFYKNTQQLPDFEEYKMAGRTYRYMKEQPLFCFGYGLSYTTFEFGTPKYNAKKGVVTVEVTNTGKRDGDEVVQVYIKRIADTEGPNKTLKAFKRVSLKAGEKKVISIDFKRGNFEGWDPEHNVMRVVAGKYQMMVGNSSRDCDLKTIEVKVK
ncbi:MAG: glycoside hydrolase family 3 C-terminal domain-containing protein [Prevotella sp.]|nr:glycoside hydrolase family 3 C-terminal domain-containing protein [Prevotellaceae bacterium]MDY5250321.1 glycoside hydrolase family 3 C-terminal domain-containing protein [Prevotella sp.]